MPSGLLREDAGRQERRHPGLAAGGMAAVDEQR
jgi:hypothetical protein